MRPFGRWAAGIAVAIALLVAVPATQAAGRCGDHSWCNTALSPDERAALVVRALTRDEKVGMLGGEDLQGVGGAEGTHTGTDRGVPRIGLPPVYYTDGPVGVRSGRATAMPSPIGLAATFDRSLARDHGAVIGDEAKHKGNDVVFAPTVNIMRTPLGGRTFESYGEDPYLMTRLGVEWLRGAQAQGVIGNVKHYAVNNQEGVGASAPGAPIGVGVVGNRLTVDAQVDDRTLREVYLPHFEAAVKEANVGSVMCSYNRINGPYACQNPRMLEQILRREWGFKGYVLADYGAAKDTRESLLAGLDFDPFPAVAYSPALVNAALAGGVPESVLDTRVTKILRTLFAYGFFDRAAYTDTPAAIDRKGHATRAERIARAGSVLLKNEGGALPLERGKVRSLAVIGPDADRYKSGGGSSNVVPYESTSPLKGIRAAAGQGADVIYDDGSDPARTARVARAADAAVVVVADTYSEGADKPCLGLNCGASDLFDRDALIERVADANKRTVAVLETGGPVLMPWRAKVPAILEAWYPGLEGGTAIGRVLFGEDPGGRLPVTFPRREADLPTAGDPEKYPGVAEAVKYKEGVLVGHRWFDTKGIEPAFAFGHGLSYTSFAYRDLKITPAAGGRSAATVTARVTNTGRRHGSEIPQLYLGLPSPGAGVNQPPRALKGFERVRVNPGKSKTVTFKLGERDLSYWSTAANGWRVAPGCYSVMVGSSSRDIRLRGSLAQGGARCACPSGTGFRSASLRPRGKRVGFQFERGTENRVTVDVLRYARGRTVGKPRRVARYRNRSKSFTWRGRGARRDGIYAVRLRTLGLDGRPDTRVLTLRRKRGRFTARRPFVRKPSCGLVAAARLNAPAFGGRRRAPLRAAYRLGRNARVAVTVTRGRRVVKRFRTRSRTGGRLYPLRLGARGRKRGEYRVRITARAGRERVRVVLAARRL